MKIKNTFAKNLSTLGAVIALSATAMQVSAQEVWLDMSWTGQNGYTASGYFAYDNDQAGLTVIGSELSDFYLQGFDPQGSPVGEFSFEDIDDPENRFVFGFDTMNGRIILTGETDPNEEHADTFQGFMAGLNYSDNATGADFIMSSRIGCSSTYPGENEPEIDMYLGEGRSCSATSIRVDTGLVGTGIDVTPRISPETHLVSISIDEGQGSIPAEGGKLKYDATISNLDLAENAVTKWSVLTFPTGEDYGIHKASVVTIGAEDVKNYTRPYITIKDWFPAGEYSFSWYVADPDNSDIKIVVDTFTFEKLSD